MAINTGTIPAFLDKQIKSFFGVTYESYQPQYVKFLDKETSDKDHEEYQGIGGLGLYSSVAQGANSVEDTILQGYKTNIVNLKYAKHFDVLWKRGKIVSIETL